METALDTVARLEGSGDDSERTAARALRAWVNLDPAQLLQLLQLLPTRGGNARALRVSLCGVAFLARRAGVVGFARRACKDRVCPFCSARRSRMFAAALRAWLDANQWIHRVFATFTQRKGVPMHWEEAAGAYVGETAAGSLDRLLAAWRRFTERYGRHLLIGGLRSMEVTARKAGELIGEHEVKHAGLHAHLHCLLDVRRCALVRCLRRPTNRNRRGDLDDRPRVTLLAAAWVRSSPGAREVAVDIQALDESRVYQACKYAVDMSGLIELVEGAPGYVRGVLRALHGRRTVATFGTWRGADLGLREKPGSLEYGDRALYTLATNEPGEAAPVHWACGEVQSAESVLAELLTGGRRRPL